ncbi:hypothetical protein HDU81_010248 [Chytriomyces hyalinus]|nr:hypothetical protein HDU81_010248 [Chytriomyces hyalinus]
MSTNITLASVSSYCSLNYVTLEGSYMSNYTTAFNPSFMDMDDNTGWTFYGDLALVAAIERVNSDPNILPGVHVNLKRFTDCGAYYPEARMSYDGNSGGYAAAVTAMDIVEGHTDVVGVVGNEFSSAAMGIGEILSFHQIPFCGNCATSPRFSDKNKYPYYWRPLPPVSGDSFLLVLNTWNVKRVAIVYEKDDELGLASAQIIQQSLVQGGIKIIASVAVPGEYDKAAYDAGSKSLKTTHSRYTKIKTFPVLQPKYKYFSLLTSPRYVILVGSYSFTGASIYRLAKSGLNHTEMVYMADNSLHHYTDPTITFGPDYFDLVRGFIWVTNPVNPVQEAARVVQAVVNRIAGADISFGYFYPYYMAQAYDCTMMLLLGFHKVLLQENPKYTAEMLQNRQLQQYMNWTLFKGLDYDGLTWDEMRLNPTGDLEL